MREEKLLIIKINESLYNVITKFEESFNNNIEKYYISSKNDYEKVKELKDCNFKIAFVIFKRDEQKPNKKTAKNGKDEAICLYYGDGIKIEDRKIHYKIKIKKSSKLIIDNFTSNSELDLRNDFENKSYTIIETSKDLLRQLDFIENDVYKPYPKLKEEQVYDQIEHEAYLHKYSQFNQHCIRPYGILKPQKGRGEFQRDYERIIQSKAFRRLVDKAQIFTSSKGDHYRTRMTHTMEVAEISKAIATELKLNVTLTEAIALAHDLGHTPFGHQGERTLDKILKNEIKIIKNFSLFSNDLGAFKHNFQGMRTVNYIEEKYIEFEGLDLSYQVLEGIMKHTRGKAKNCKKCTDCKKNCYELKDFVPGINKEYLFIDILHPTTLEGQIVAIADEIAQRAHDLDDSFSANLISRDELKNFLTLQKTNKLRDEILEIDKQIEEAELKNRRFIDSEELHRGRIISHIIKYFINDVIETSNKNMVSFKSNDSVAEKNLYKNNHRFGSIIIGFSKEGKMLCDYLEKIISKKVINSSEVSRFDNKASMIIESLFRAYYNNPKLLHRGTLERLYIEIRKESSEVIDFKNGDHNLVRDELHKISNADLDEIKEIENEEVQKEYLFKRKILVRNIIDYIAGMTDSYAINEYNSIFNG